MTVLFPSLARHAEKDEEEYGGDGHTPTRKLEEDFRLFVAGEQESADVCDATKVGVDPCPGAVGLRWGEVEVVGKDEHADREDEEDFGEGECHEADVAVDVEARPLGLEQLVERRAALEECTNGET